MKKLFPLLMVILFLMAACAKQELVPQPEEPQKEQKEDPSEDPEEEARINRDSYDRNFTRWKILGQYVWPNPSPIPSDYDGELSSLSNFLTQRLTWLNTAINGL